MKQYKFLLLSLLLLIGAGNANALEIVYPRSNEMQTTSHSTFFVGNSSKNIKINGQEVRTNSSNSFFYPVELNVGENIFTISEDDKKITDYKITRKNIRVFDERKSITHYEKPIVVEVIKSKTPLRNFPYDGGTTRLEHLQKGIPLNVVGEYQGFYIVQLARDSYVWVSKTNVKKLADTDNSPANIENFTYTETKDKRIYKIKLNKKVPYMLSEAKIYQTDDKMSYFDDIVNGYDFQLFNVNGYSENTYAIHINKYGEAFGFKAYYTDSNELVIEIKKAPVIDKSAPLKNITITVDPGHGGDELGAIGCNGEYEKDINLQIALFLKNLLKEKGAKVILTRDKDIELSLENRADIAKANNTDIFISIHNNSISDSMAFKNKSGTSLYYYYLQNSILAKDLQNSLLTKLELNDDKIQRASFAVVRETEYLSVLTEIGYMINPDDMEKLSNPEFQKTVAQAIVEGLEKYLSEI